ncbi:unnamed protein product [Dicrocoelium dendriticum]|nr:unnamed protein product [Dicrocoelium dendriticum]
MNPLLVQYHGGGGGGGGGGGVCGGGGGGGGGVPRNPAPTTTHYLYCRPPHASLARPHAPIPISQNA